MENQSAKARGAEPTPEPAVPAILAAFDKYEVVGMPAAHGLKDVDDFILSLIRTPAFAERVNDMAVLCGNSLYQPELDRYIAGEDVPFTSVRKVWRNTTQPMCGLSGFFEQFFPLVRANLAAEALAELADNRDDGSVSRRQLAQRCLRLSLGVLSRRAIAVSKLPPVGQSALSARPKRHGRPPTLPVGHQHSRTRKVAPRSS